MVTISVNLTKKLEMSQKICYNLKRIVSTMVQNKQKKLRGEEKNGK